MRELQPCSMEENKFTNPTYQSWWYQSGQHHRERIEMHQMCQLLEVALDLTEIMGATACLFDTSGMNKTNSIR